MRFTFGLTELLGFNDILTLYYDFNIVQTAESITMSQESVLSDMSGAGRSSSFGGGSSNKRARKCSVIRDPIYLHDLHANAQQQQLVQQ